MQMGTASLTIGVFLLREINCFFLGLMRENILNINTRVTYTGGGRGTEN